MKKKIPYLLIRFYCPLTLLVYVILVLPVIFSTPACCQPIGNSGSKVSQLSRSDEILIIVPHPDDETLGFAGIIHDALMIGKKVTVVIVTNGDGYGAACYLWKYGCPAEDTSCTFPGCTPSDFENFGNTRITESKNALNLLGLTPDHLITFGYPDGWMHEMYDFPDSVFKGNTTRRLSNTGKQFCSYSLVDDLKILFRSHPDADVFTTHLLDHHDDHATLALFIQKARMELMTEKILFPVYYTIIHEPALGNNNLWPPPLCDWESQKGTIMQKRELRYQPFRVLYPPLAMKDIPIFYFMDESMWATVDHDTCLMRLAVDKYRTAAGNICSDGSVPIPAYQGWLDRNGFLLSFIKRNHLFWEAPFPQISSLQRGPCQQVVSVHPMSLPIIGKQANGNEGDCSCQSELFGGDGLRIGSGLASGKAWYDFGPVFQDTILVTIQWADNSWKSDQKYLELYNWKTSRWDQIALFIGNDEKNHTDQFIVPIRPEHLAPLHEIRIAVSGSGYSRMHLGFIMVE